MNKAELVEAIAKKTGGTKASVEGTLDALMETVTVTLTKGDSVALIGFGTFSVSKRAARKGRNPATGAEIKISASKVAKFSAVTFDQGAHMRLDGTPSAHEQRRRVRIDLGQCRRPPDRRGLVKSRPAVRQRRAGALSHPVAGDGAGQFMSCPAT